MQAALEKCGTTKRDVTGAQLKLVLAARVEVDESTGTPIPPLFLFSIFFNSFLFLFFFFLLTLFPFLLCLRIIFLPSFPV